MRLSRDASPRVSHIPIVSEEELLKRKPEYALLLAWNYLDFFLEKSPYIQQGGRFIVPLPHPRIAHLMDSPALSVVIPVYNEEENLEQTLESLKENVRAPYEILIVYDFDEDRDDSFGPSADDPSSKPETR